MSGPIRTEALIHDLAIVLRGCLHESAEVGLPGRLAANRISDVLGITPGELTAGIEDRLAAALAELPESSGEGCDCSNPYCPCSEPEDDDDAH